MHTALGGHSMSFLLTWSDLTVSLASDDHGTCKHTHIAVWRLYEVQQVAEQKDVICQNKEADSITTTG